MTDGNTASAVWGGVRPIPVRSALATGVAVAVLAAAGAQAADREDIAERDEIVVTASGFEQRIEQAPASISLIPRAELQEMRAASLAEALSYVEGVDVGGSAGKTGGLNISIRGMGSDYTLVLIDGRRQNAAGNITPNGFGESSTSFMPPLSAIERIEVVRGPVSTLYGSDAMGGVINIITRKVGDRWVGTASGDATIQGDGDFGNIYGGSAYLQGPLAKDLVGLTLRGSYRTRAASTLTYEDVGGGVLEVSKRGPSPVKSEIWSLGGRVSVTPHPDHDVMFDADVNRQWYDNSEGQLGTLGIQGYAEAQEFDQEEYVLAHNWRLPFGEMQNTVSHAKRETIGRIVPEGVPGAGGPRRLEATNTIVDSKVFSQWRNHTFTIGGQFWDAVMHDGVAVSPYTHQQWAGFAEDEWRLTPTLAVTGGVRYDHHSRFGSHVSPRGYVVWNATDNWTLKGGLSRGFKTPRLDQIAEGITGFTGQGTRPTIGTPSLQPETSTSSEIAIFYDNRNNFRANVTVFNNNFNDKIASGIPLNNCSFGLSEADYLAGVEALPDCADYGYWPLVETYSQTVNIDEAVTRGVEASFRFNPFDSVSVTGNYTYTHSEQKSGEDAGRPLQNTPPHMINAAVRWNATDRLSTWIRAEYRSSRYRNEDSATSTAKATWGDYRAYSIFHLGASYSFTDKLAVNATVYNLLNKDFVTYGAYVSNINTNAISYTNLYANNQEPRRVWVSLVYDF